MDFFNHLMSGYTPILIFIFLCFAALMIFFIKLSRNLEELIRIARYDRTALLDQLAVMQNSLEDLVRYQSDTYNFFQGLYQDDTSTPIEESEQPYLVSEEAYAEPEDLAFSEEPYAAAPDQTSDSGVTAAGAAFAGAAAGLAAGTLIDEQGQETTDTAFDAVPDLSELVDDDVAFPDSGDSAIEDFSDEEFDLTLGDTIPPAAADAAADISDATYESMAEETMEFNDTDYAHYSSALAEKQAKEDFSITPELDDLMDEQEDVIAVTDEDSSFDAENDLVLEGMDLDFSPDEGDEEEAGLADFTLDLDSPSIQETDLQKQDFLLDETEDLGDDDLLIETEEAETITDAPDESVLDLSLDSVETDDEDEELDFSLGDDGSAEIPEQPETFQDAVPELNFHEEPESEISMALEEEDDSIYLLDEPLTTDEETAQPDDLQEFELSGVAEPSAPPSPDEELDMDLFNDTIREPAPHEVASDDSLDGDIVMDFPLEEETPEFDTEFDVEPQHIDLDFQLEDESESDQGVVLHTDEQEFTLDDDENDDVIISEDDDVDEDDSDLDLLVDNLLDVPEDVNLDVDSEDIPDFETAIVIEDDDDEPLVEEPVIAVSNTSASDTEEMDLLPADLSDDDLLLDEAAEVITNEDEMTFDFDKPQFSTATSEDPEEMAAETPEAEPDEEISTQDMMLTLDETIELDKTAASKQDPSPVDETFAGTGELLDDHDTSNGFLLDGLMDLPGQNSGHDFSFGSGEQEDPFSLQDLDITIMDQDDTSISLEPGDEDAEEDDIVLPDVSFKTLPDADADASTHADDLLELETDDLVDASEPDAIQNTGTGGASAADADNASGETKKKSANILDFIIDQ